MERRDQRGKACVAAVMAASTSWELAVWTGGGLVWVKKLVVVDIERYQWYK